jgi:hypothetical protein
MQSADGQPFHQSDARRQTCIHPARCEALTPFRRSRPVALAEGSRRWGTQIGRGRKASIPALPSASNSGRTPLPWHPAQHQGVIHCRRQTGRIGFRSVSRLEPGSCDVETRQPCDGLGLKSAITGPEQVTSRQDEWLVFSVFFRSFVDQPFSHLDGTHSGGLPFTPSLSIRAHAIRPPEQSLDLGCSCMG